mgnify:CR=1 FL=1
MEDIRVLRENVEILMDSIRLIHDYRREEWFKILTTCSCLITYSNITLGQPQVSTRFLVESNDNDGCNQLKFEVCSDIAMGIY